MDWTEVAKKAGDMGLKLLGTAMGGPAGGGIASLLSGWLFGDKDNGDFTPDKFLEALGNPETFLKMKEFEMTHKVELEKIALETERIFIADRQSARNMNIETTKATGKRDINLYVLSWVIVIGFFGLVALLIFKELPKDSNGVIFMLFGALGSGFTGIIGYFFGSSKGSDEKTQLLAKAQPIP